MFYDIFSKLCQERGIKPSKAADECGINKSNVSNWKNNGYIPRGDALKKLATYFNVSVDYLLGKEHTKEKEMPALTEKDERDIEKELNKTLESLENGQDGLMFSGEPLDDQTKDLLAVSLRNSMELAKRIAKNKYTPKKYRK